MQWDDLRVFLAVAQGGSLRKAARALRLGQPTIGRHLHQLELSVGARLFERSANWHRLTREGKKLPPMAQSMADAAAAIDRRRAALGSDVRSAVRIVAGEWATRFLAPRLSAPTRTAISPSLSPRVISIPISIGARRIFSFATT